MPFIFDYRKEVEGRIDEPLQMYLKREYVENERSMKELASELDVSFPTLGKFFDDFGIIHIIIN